ncbi:MAG: hypothetical protein E7055_08210 [Lentisphaerae bacterium]|nr:hypothetical protein [Lentisphaerota bacterium]
MSNQQKNEGIFDNVIDSIGKVGNKVIHGIQGYRPKFEQHVALFGESGCGKTTLLTVFYGYQQAVKFQKEAGYRLLADDLTQGQNLLSSFYNITTKPIAPTRLTSREYSFTIRPEGASQDAGRLVWHDYPGEWWTETKTEEEQKDKEETFLSLISSDVALFLVDGAKLKIQGDKYIKYLFCNFRDEISRLKNYPTLKAKFPLTHFPRIWLICLAKSDIMPNVTAEDFKKRILSVANEELQAVKQEIREIIEEPELFNLGDDYLLLSAAEYDEKNESIKDIEKRKGVDLIAPIAFTVPVKRSLWWARKKEATISTMTGALEIIRKLTTGWLKWIPLVGYYFGLLDQIAKNQVINLTDAKEKAIKKGNFIDAVLIAFEQKLSAIDSINTYIGCNEESSR